MFLNRRHLDTCMSEDRFAFVHEATQLLAGSVANSVHGISWRERLRLVGLPSESRPRQEALELDKVFCRH